ncbi:hypothetical protein QUG98_00175 [Curtobacterium sp. RHCJP20]|uniref:SAF domain-containing protein n=1 Tax=Curtobacterium subtropicum TaxID=3055138 RepID=A0ABT7TBA3_9MICO|nr:hypothetical protein [Curtobacterium subtropicum]MDM7886857.1 hypothetical protein [Curtobacterium subtropicum]
MGRRARRGPLAGLLALAVVVSGLGAAWLVTGDDDGSRAARPTDRPTVPMDGSVPVDASGPVDGSGPLAVSNALGAPIPGTEVRQGVPRSVEDWVDRVLPVAGSATPLVDGFAATVRIERTAESTVAVRVDGLAVPPTTRAVRLVLAPDATPDLGVLAEASSVVTLPVAGDAAGGSSLTVDAAFLQADTRSAALVDDETDEVLGVALLVPAD